MQKVIIASKNPVKIEAVCRSFKKMLPDKEFEFIGISVSSDIPQQPFSNQETFAGAHNRVMNASRQIPSADFYVGIEGGIEIINREGKEEMENFAWVIIKSGNQIGKSRTGTFFLPPKIIELIKAGKELGDADDIVFNRHNSKQQNGASGILTGNAIDRTTYYTEALILALIPFRNVDLYRNTY